MAVDRNLLVLREDMRAAVLEFRKFDQKWNALNDELNSYLDRMGITDILQREKVKAANVTLKGHLSGASWWRDRAAMLAAVINAEVAVRQEFECSVRS